MSKIREETVENSRIPYSIFNLDIPEEYRSYTEDLSRMCMIQLVANSLFHMTNSSKYPLFGADFCKTLLFIIVGVSAYWLVFRKLVSFGPVNTGHDSGKFYYGGGY